MRKTWVGRSPGGGHGNPIQYSFLENPHGQRSLAGYSPWGRKVGDNGVTKHIYALGFPMRLSGKESPVNAGDTVSPLGQEDPLEKGMATHSSVFAWRISWTASLVGYSPQNHKGLDMI